MKYNDDCIEQNHERLEYRPDGSLVWASRFGGRAPKGVVAGSVDTHGYVQIKMDGVTVLAHRVIWFKFNGTFPPQVDHEDRNRANNRIENLRASDGVLNPQNAGIRADNTSGHQGVTERNGRWTARIATNGKRIQVGTFDTADEAGAAYQAAKAKHHPHTMVKP